MNRRNSATFCLNILSVAALALAGWSCAVPQRTALPDSARVQPGISPLEIQALVMSMADDYIAALGESVYLFTRRGEVSPKGRWLAQSFLRNGVGASIEIGAGANPPVDLLDLLVLASLQTWSFEAHWIPAGIGEAGRPALARLKRAEADMWVAARQILGDEQLITLRGLIDAYIAENPDRTVVASVRFGEFAEERRINSLSMRAQAQGLLQDVSAATAAIDDARLLGERLLWYAGRYPYLLGEQTELTAYRLIDQPEGAQLVELLASAQRLSDALAGRIDTLEGQVNEQLEAFFARVSAERASAIGQAQQALEATVQRSLDDATRRINAERVAAIEQLFGRLARERSVFFDDIESRQEELRGLLSELREAVSVSGALAHELTGTVDAIDRVVSRFDADGESEREPLSIAEVRDVARETTRAAEEMARVLELSNELVESGAWDARIASLVTPANAVVDRAFWRGVILIGLLIGGLALLRLVSRPSSARGSR